MQWKWGCVSVAFLVPTHSTDMDLDQQGTVYNYNLDLGSPHIRIDLDLLSHVGSVIMDLTIQKISSECIDCGQSLMDQRKLICKACAQGRGGEWLSGFI